MGRPDTHSPNPTMNRSLLRQNATRHVVQDETQRLRLSLRRTKSARDILANVRSQRDLYRLSDNLKPKGLQGFDLLVDELVGPSRETSNTLPEEEEPLVGPGGLTRRNSLKVQDLVHLHVNVPTFWRILVEERCKDWAGSFRRTDPRFRILKFFDDVAQEGAIDVCEKGIQDADLLSPILRCFQRASVFTVWRPTSLDAIRKMMKGEAVGKGLDIKGKSARSGNISGFVPFLQIHKEEHKRQVRTLPKDAVMRVFYQKAEHRNDMVQHLNKVAQEMVRGYDNSRQVLKDDTADDARRERALECFMWEMENPNVILVDDYVENGAFGLEIPERLFWEAYVVRQDIRRTPNSSNDIKRASQPAFQDMNFKALRNPKQGKPRPVVWQFNREDPRCPLDLLMAYEENGQVRPVVSDFDCFLLGTRGVTYKEPLPQEQVEMLNWCVNNIGAILSNPDDKSWTLRWLDVLKQTEKAPKLPLYGYADPKSYAVMKNAVYRLKDDGCVRHGSESFNFYFPQELDEEFLVISDMFPGKVKWKYVDVKGLQDILKMQVKMGFTFPLNPKWVLCDPGWKDIYDELLSSQMKNVQDSVNIWFPPQVRARIEEIHKQNSLGFNKDPLYGESDHRRSVLQDDMDDEDMSGTTAMDLAEQELNRYRSFKRAKAKLRVYVRLLHFMSKAQEKKKC